MSGYRTKVLRAVFEMKTGFTPLNRSNKEYKKQWRFFKKNHKIK